MDSLFSHFEGGSPVLQFIGNRLQYVYDHHEQFGMYLHLILSALFPIIIGAHASLKRPPSSAPSEKEGGDTEEDDELDGEVNQDLLIEGLTPSDAILFPVIAGLTLGSLYLVIKWMKDAKILNKILNYYFSVLGVFGVGRLAGDVLNVAATFLFPSVWSSGKETYYVEPLLSVQVSGPVKKARALTTRKNVEDKTNPLPGFLSTIKFSDSVTKKLWAYRALLKNHWIFRGYLHGIFNHKQNVYLNDVIGLVIGMITVVLYNTNGKAWWLTNAIGFGFCYGTLQIMSLTTFWTGTLVLAGLFVYDIAMVFYTPMMITVATSIDAPIKLIFPGPGRGSMLGLGDVVLPGIMMAFALRFDLYLHYLRKQRVRAYPKNTPIEKRVPIKAPYVEATGRWGERFWTRTAPDAESSTKVDGARFSKVYFKASVVGYVTAMIVTMVVMTIFNHAQPALLYLVPGVLSSLWGTGLVRGELKLMWEYTEDGVWGFEDEPQSKSKEEKKIAESDKSEGDKEKEKVEAKADNEHSHHVFLFSLSEPKKGKGAKLFSKN